MDLSVVIITHQSYFSNFRLLASRLLESLSADSKERIEIIAVVQYSGLRPVELDDIQRLASPSFRIIEVSEVLSPSRARNLGISESTAGFIHFIDGDCLVEPNYAQAALEIVGGLANRDLAVQGPLYSSRSSYFGKYEFLFDIISLLELPPRQALPFYRGVISGDPQRLGQAYLPYHGKKIRKLQGYNFLAARTSLDKVGGLPVDAVTAEDRELASLFNRNAIPIDFDATLVVHHDYDMSLGRILNRKRWHAIGCAKMIKVVGGPYDGNRPSRTRYYWKLFLLTLDFSLLWYKIVTDAVFWKAVRENLA